MSSRRTKLRFELDALIARLETAIEELNQKDAEIEGAVLLVAGTAPTTASGTPPSLPPGFDPAAMGEQLRSVAAQMSGVGGSVETVIERIDVNEKVANSHDAAWETSRAAAEDASAARRNSDATMRWGAFMTAGPPDLVTE